MSRETVRKVLRSGATEFRYERRTQPRPKIGPWQSELEGMLSENASRPKRERLTLMRMFEDLRALGYEGGYDAVRRHAARWRADREAGSVSEAHVPLAFDPGEAYQFDWSHEDAVLGGKLVRVKVAHMRLCHSRMFFVRAYPQESQEMVFDAHEKAFAFFGGSCVRGIYDNMRTVVDAVFAGKDRSWNARFLRMCSHHLVDPVACTPASGWEKGQVENQVRFVRRRLFSPRPKFESLAELNAWLEDRCVALAARRQSKGRARVEHVFAHQKDPREASEAETPSNFAIGIPKPRHNPTASNPSRPANPLRLTSRAIQHKIIWLSEVCITVNRVTHVASETQLLNKMSEDYLNDGYGKITMKRLRSMQKTADTVA